MSMFQYIITQNLINLNFTNINSITLQAYFIFYFIVPPKFKQVKKKEFHYKSSNMMFKVVYHLSACEQ